MNAREKKLLIAVGGLLGLFLGFLAVKAVFTRPLRQIDKKIAAVHEKLEKIKSERRAYFAAEDLVKRCAQTTFSDQIDQASAQSGELLTKQIIQSGLREADFSRLPAGPRKLGGAVEIGWSVQGHGALANVIDLLFVLQELPYVHRIENLTFSTGERPGQVRVGFRLLTLVLDPAPIVEPAALQAKYTPQSPERRIFDGIVARDLLRPYIKRSPASGGTPPDSPVIASGPNGLRIVSLSEWMGQPEVHVRDLATRKTSRYRIGDPLGEATVAAIDYRPLPLPGNEALKSYSRVILRIGKEYWAVERGQTLADKRPLPPQDLPDNLAKVAQSQQPVKTP